MEDAKILLVDDEQDILQVLSYNLKKEGYTVYTASNGKQALEQTAAIIPDLILMDVMMPEMDGIEACMILRERSALDSCVIAFLTARGEDYSQIAGFEAGADDYITKPIKPKLLLSKVKGLLRRSQKENNKLLIAVGENIVIDLERYLVINENVEHELPKKEFDLFALLASKPGYVFTRERIMSEVWGNEVVVGDRTIDVHIRKLREKFGSELIGTIKGVGYKLT